MVAVNVVDDVMFARSPSVVYKIISRIQEIYEYETIVRGPAKFLFFGLTITQESEFDISVLKAIESYPTIVRDVSKLAIL